MVSLRCFFFDRTDWPTKYNCVYITVVLRCIRCAVCTNMHICVVYGMGSCVRVIVDDDEVSQKQTRYDRLDPTAKLRLSTEKRLWCGAPRSAGCFGVVLVPRSVCELLDQARPQLQRPVPVHMMSQCLCG